MTESTRRVSLSLDGLDPDAIRFITDIAGVEHNHHDAYPIMERVCRSFRTILRGRGHEARLWLAVRLTRRTQRAPEFLALSRLDLGPLLNSPDGVWEVWEERSEFEAFCDVIYAAIDHVDLFRGAPFPISSEKIYVRRLTSANAYALAVQQPILSVLRAAALACAHRNFSNESVACVLGADVVFARMLVLNIPTHTQFIGFSWNWRTTLKSSWKMRLVPVFARLAGITRFSACFFEPVWTLILDVCYFAMKKALVHVMSRLLPSDMWVGIPDASDASDASDGEFFDDSSDEDERSDSSFDSVCDRIPYTYIDDDTTREFENHERRNAWAENHNEVVGRGIETDTIFYVLSPTANAFVQGALNQNDFWRTTEMVERPPTLLVAPLP